MTLTIDTKVASALQLNPTQYLVCQLCAQYEPLKKGTGVGHVSEVLCCDSGSVTKAMRHLIDVGLINKSENGFYYPTSKWYLAHDGEEVVVTTHFDEMAKEVIEFFNQVNATKYQLHNNSELVVKILKQNNKLTIDHFKSVIVHKHETWAADDKMSQYNRPSTLFSGKFLKYLDDANHYWIQKQKHDSTTQILGN